MLESNISRLTTSMNVTSFVTNVTRNDSGSVIWSELLLKDDLSLRELENVTSASKLLLEFLQGLRKELELTHNSIQDSSTNLGILPTFNISFLFLKL